jgi:hypothetical protein
MRSKPGQGHFEKDESFTDQGYVDARRLEIGLPNAST